MINLSEFIEMVEEHGSLELNNSVYLLSQENAIAEQKGWEDEDPNKNLDFSEADWWVIATSDNEPDIQAYNSIEEAIVDF